MGCWCLIRCFVFCWVYNNRQVHICQHFLKIFLIFFYYIFNILVYTVYIFIFIIIVYTITSRPTILQHPREMFSHKKTGSPMQNLLRGSGFSYLFSFPGYLRWWEKLLTECFLHFYSSWSGSLSGWSRVHRQSARPASG